MELIIIALIAVEVVIVKSLFSVSCRLTEYFIKALIRDGPELWQMALGEDV
jgi:hypothetical protein